jgi:hypothetical protein
MTLPASVTTVTVTMRYTRQVGDATGVPCSGTVKFRTSATMTVPTDNMILPPDTTVATLDASGQASVVLCALDDPQILETGLTYQVTEDIAGAPQRNYDLALSTSQAPTVDLADIVPAVAQPSTITYIPVSTIDAKGDLLVGTGDNGIGRLAVGTDGLTLRPRASASAGVAWERTPDWGASDHGLLTWSGEPAAFGSSTAPTPAGTITFAKVFLPSAQTVTNVLLYAVAGGSVLTSGQCFAALYTAAGSLVAQTADQAASWASAGLKTMALAGGAQPLAAGGYTVAWWYNGTTSPAWARGGNQAAGFINIGLASPSLRFGTADTGRTTTAPGTLGAQTASSTAWWAALS